MKPPWAILSAARPYALILSVSMHVLLFSIPVSVMIKPPNRDLELFVSIEDRRVPDNPVKAKTEIKKPPPKAVKEIGKPMEVQESRIKKPVAIEPVREVRNDPPVQAMEEPATVESVHVRQSLIEEGPQMPPDPVIKQMDRVDLPSDPVKEILNPVKGVRNEPPGPSKKEPKKVDPVPIRQPAIEETPRISPDSMKRQVEVLPFNTEKPATAGPVKETEKHLVDKGKKHLLRGESKPALPSVTGDVESVILPPLLRGASGLLTDVPVGEKSAGRASDGKAGAPGRQHVAGIIEGNPVETRFGASVAPAFLHREMPVYPMMARRLGKEGRVLLKLTIDEKGNLSDVEVIEKAGYGLTEAAVEAVKKSTFLPAKKDGKSIVTRALLPVKFQLERKGW